MDLRRDRLPDASAARSAPPMASRPPTGFFGVSNEARQIERNCGAGRDASTPGPN